MATWSQLYDTYNGVLDSSRLLLLNDRETVHNNRTVFSREAISPLTPYTYFHVPHGRTVWYVWMNSIEPEYKAILEQVVLSMKFGSHTPTALKEAYGSNFDPMPLQPKPMNSARELPVVWGDLFPPIIASIANDYITPVAVTEQINCGHNNAPVCPNGTHGPQHYGAENAIDIDVGIGTNVRSSATSTLYSANWSNDGYGNHVVLYDSQNNYLAYYAHLDWFYIEPGLPVPQGGFIGQSGDSGAGGPHLHFHVQTTGGNPVDLAGMPGLTLNADYPNCGESESSCPEEGGAGFDCDCGQVN